LREIRRQKKKAAKGVRKERSLLKLWLMKKKTIWILETMNQGSLDIEIQEV
jgi:hypothetical protein